jgi:hypothetical protein
LRETYLWAFALALEAASKIVHNNIRAAASEEDGILAPKPTTGARDNDRLAIIPQVLSSHDVISALDATHSLEQRKE